ncbi:MAG TPA: hypothetical protein VIP09_08240 [Dehalococcoidia bacterium]|jgi:hypothetical protein
MAAPLLTLRTYQAEAGRAIVDSVLNRRGLTFTVVIARQAGKNEISPQVEPSTGWRTLRRSSQGRDNYLVSLALTAHAARDPLSPPGVARGLVQVPALN